MNSVLTTNLNIGEVQMNVSNIEKMKHYYVDLVGLEIVSQDASSLFLGYKKHIFLRLIHTPQLPFPSLASAGLYHNAILYSSRSSLALALKRFAESNPHFYEGSANHLVSEAFYLSDPEGNGVELYFDIDSSKWKWNDGKIVMGSEPLDANEFIRTYAKDDSNSEKRMGHIHLKVGDIAKAKEFYIDILGMHMTADMPSALFTSDGTYHHVIGMNTWESRGAGVRSETLGLRSFDLVVHSKNDILGLKERLQKAKIAFQDHTDITVKDPWGTVIQIRSL